MSLTPLDVTLSAIAVGLILVLVLVLAWSHRYRRTRIQLTLDVQRDLHDEDDHEQCPTHHPRAPS